MSNQPVSPPSSHSRTDTPPSKGEATELLTQNENLRFLTEGEEDLIAEDSEVSEFERRQKLPWWKRPSPLWLLIAIPFTAIASSSTTAPRIEIYTTLVCNAHKPEYSSNHLVSLGSSTLDGFLPPVHLTFDGNVHFNNTIRVRALDDTDENEKRRKFCSSNPVIQAAVAKLTIAMTSSMGILSCLTAGWWGSVSDRHGRVFVLGISIIGLLVADFIFIVVSLFAQRLPGGYWLLVVGPILEGILGGLVGAISAVHAYMADCTTGSSRSRTFSLSLGLLFAGSSLGPTFGGLIIRETKQTLSVFYVAATVHLLYAILTWVFLPESVSSMQMAKALVRHREERGTITRERGESNSMRVLMWARPAFQFLSPLSIFLPRVERQASPLKGPSRDWGLTMLVLAYGLTITTMGSLTTRLQFAASTFGWNSEILGYWLTLVGITRAMCLTLAIPLIIKYFKPKPVPTHLPAGESAPLLASTSSTYTTSALQPSTPNPLSLREQDHHSAAFDLCLARASLVIEIISYTLTAIIPTPAAFTICAMTAALGMGFSPAVQCVALEMYARRGGKETGKLFGALSVVQALCSSTLGPMMFGFVYMKTVGTYPRTIFFLIVAAVTTSFIFLSLVRLPDKPSSPSVGDDVEDVMLRDGDATETRFTG